MNLPDMKNAKKRKETEVKYIKHKYEGPLFGTNKKYYVRTYGCQMNVHDSENIRGLLESAGYTESSDINTSDIVILNTCAIRENAHDKVFGFLGVLNSLKRKNKNLIVGICGCMAQEKSVVDKIMEKYKFVDFVCGTHNFNNLLNIISESVKSNNQQIEVYSYDGDVIEDIPVKKDNNYSAWVNIILGCDKFCTYCIVPYTRGTERSRKKEDIVSEVKNLVKEGYKEVTLLGQNVNAYGKDLYENYNLANLLEDISDTKIERIRFVTSHPWDFTDEMIDVIASKDNVMPYIHLPVQSGSNKILKLMNRRYTREEYITLYNKIRNKVKNSTITTDIIVGFPGETEKDFEETLDLVNTCKFDGAFTFSFSPRENTPAMFLKETVDEETKMDRLHRLNKLINKYSNESNKRLLGTTQKCLVTGASEKDKSKVCGYTENMKLVNIEANIDTIGKIIDVNITDTKSFSLDGIHIK